MKKNRVRFCGFNLTYTTMWDIKMWRKEAGYRKAPGGVPAFPYFLVLFAYLHLHEVRVNLSADGSYQLRRLLYRRAGG